MHQTSCTWQEVKFFHLKTYNVILPVVMKNPLFRMQKKSFENCYPFIYYLEHGKIIMNYIRQLHFPFNQCCYFMELVNCLKHAY